jgi:hypothetical protein
MKPSLLALIFCLSLRAHAQQNAGISVIRDKAAPFVIQPADWTVFRRIEINAKDKDGITHAFSGVALSDLLQKAGVAMGGQLRGANMAQYLLVKAGDGYEVVFSLPELDSAFAQQTILLADQMDSKPLPAGRGSYRIIVPAEKRPARWIWDVRTLEVHFAKD